MRSLGDADATPPNPGAGLGDTDAMPPNPGAGLGDAGATAPNVGTGRGGTGATAPSTGTGLGGSGGEPVLRVHGVSKRYGSREALREVSFATHPGEMVAVIGPNGAGKTTLLSILAGVQTPSAGTVSRGAGIQTPSARTVSAGAGVQTPSARTVRRGAEEIGSGVGWVPQNPALYSKLSVAENLRLFARLEKVGDPEAVVARMLDQTGLSDRAHERVDRLSGGTRQRVNVAIGLLANPPVVLLDEPSSSLDPAQRERLWQFVRALAEDGTSVLFSTHIVAEAQRYAQRVLVLDQGRLLFDDPPAQLAREGDPAGSGDFEQAFVSFLRKRASP